MESKKIRLILWVIGGLALLLLAFGFGTVIGYRAAAFRENIDGHYFADFFGVHFAARPFGPLFAFRGPNPHGDIGKVVDVGTSTLSIVNPYHDEGSVVVASGTIIEENGAAIKIGGIRPGDMIAAIGAPNGSGQVLARFIRVFPAVPASAQPMPSSSGGQ